MQNFQQFLVRRSWNPQIKKIEIYMIIRGKIINVVQLKDIGKRIEYGKELTLTEYEVNKSKDLQNAIKRNWVDIVFDRGMLKRAVTVQQSQQTQTDILDIAKKMAQTMAEEMIKNSPLVKGIAKEIAKEMVTEIRDNLKIEQVVQQPTDNKIDLNKSNDIFVDFKDEEVEITSNIKDIGTVEVQKDDLTSSLEKMRKFRQSQKDQ